MMDLQERMKMCSLLRLNFQSMPNVKEMGRLNDADNRQVLYNT
jgi:hypothetical protein